MICPARYGKRIFFSLHLHFDSRDNGGYYYFCFSKILLTASDFRMPLPMKI